MKSVDGIITPKRVMDRIYEIFAGKYYASTATFVTKPPYLPKTLMPPGTTLPMGDTFDGIVRPK